MRAEIAFRLGQQVTPSSREGEDPKPSYYRIADCGMSVSGDSYAEVLKTIAVLFRGADVYIAPPEQRKLKEAELPPEYVWLRDTYETPLLRLMAGVT